MRLRVTRRSHGRRENGRLRIYRKDDEFDGTESELKAFADRLERIDNSDLVQQAEALGIQVDKRWGEKRLKEEIASMTK